MTTLTTLTLTDHERHAVEAMRSEFRDRLARQPWAIYDWVVSIGARRNPITDELLAVSPTADMPNVCTFRFPMATSPAIEHAIEHRLRIIAAASDAYCATWMKPVAAPDRELVASFAGQEENRPQAFWDQIARGLRDAMKTRDASQAIVVVSETHEPADVSMLYVTIDQGQVIREPWLDLGRWKSQVRVMSQLRPGVFRSQLRRAAADAWDALSPFVVLGDQSTVRGGSR